MKVKKRNVYYCDFCNKRSLRSLKTHEKHCTANPDRFCRLCGRESIREIIDKYRTYFEVKETMDDKSWCDGTVNVEVIYHNDFSLQGIINYELNYECPNCIFAIIRCLGLNRYYFDKKYQFDYKKALEDWWYKVNTEQRRQDEYDSWTSY